MSSRRISIDGDSTVKGRVIRTLAIGAMFAMTTLWAAKSQNIFEKLVMPGPLVDGHAKLEKDCLQCHVPFSRQSQSNLCLACHKEIAADRLACW